VSQLDMQNERSLHVPFGSIRSCSERVNALSVRSVEPRRPRYRGSAAQRQKAPASSLLHAGVRREGLSEASIDDVVAEQRLRGRHLQLLQGKDE
jgi:hypothetical protein